MDRSREIADWVTQNPPFIFRQKIAVSAAAAFCFLSTAVCAPMGGAGGQSLFKTDNLAAYWLFFILSPILVYFLCGRAAYRAVKFHMAPEDRLLKELSKPPPTRAYQLSRYAGFLLLSCIAGAFNAYNTLHYIPYGFALICVVPALIIPGFAMVPAFIEYHKRIWTTVRFLFRGSALKNNSVDFLKGCLKESEREYRQFSVEQRREADAVFVHIYTHTQKKLNALFDPSELLKTPSIQLKKPKLAYAMGFLGFVIGSMAELYAFQLGRNMAASTGPVVSALFGVTEAYVRMGISAVATMDVLMDMVDDVFYFRRTRTTAVTKGQALARFGLLALALTSSLPIVQNQVETMGHEGAFGHILAICASIGPTCVFFWAGDLVFQDYLHESPGLSYMDAHDRLFSGLGSFKDAYRQALSNFSRPHY